MNNKGIVLSPQEAATVLSALSAAIQANDIGRLLEAQRLVAKAVSNSDSRDEVADILGRSDVAWLRRPGSEK